MPRCCSIWPKKCKTKSEADRVTASKPSTSKKRVETMELRRMLSGEQDHTDALVSINAGAGGVDAQDWADMLRRMYYRWAERRGFAIEELDLQEGEEAGIKSVSRLRCAGRTAFGYLKRREWRASLGADLAV
jgi:peptide chain release factor 2